MNSMPVHTHLSVDFKVKQNQWVCFPPSQIRSPSDLCGPYLCVVMPVFSKAKSSHQWEACIQTQWRNIIQVETICNLTSRELNFVSNLWALVRVRTLIMKQREMTLFKNRGQKFFNISFYVLNTLFSIFKNQPGRHFYWQHVHTGFLGIPQILAVVLYVNAVLFHQWTNYSVSTPCNIAPSEDAFVDWQMSLSPSPSFYCPGIGSLHLMRVNISDFPTYTVKK